MPTLVLGAKRSMCILATELCFLCAFFFSPQYQTPPHNSTGTRRLFTAWSGRWLVLVVAGGEDDGDDTLCVNGLGNY